MDRSDKYWMSTGSIETRIIQTIQDANFHLEILERTSNDPREKVQVLLHTMQKEWAEHKKTCPICSNQMECAEFQTSRKPKMRTIPAEMAG